MAKTVFSAAAVVATGVQTSHARFGDEARRRDDLRTPICPWRCNLTALSQRANLYFVAYADRIYVYIPQYRTQALPEQPALIVTSQPSTPARPGYIDARRPHAINNLVVQCLGEEEIIATVRDDGDVDAFFVRQVIHAIERRAEPGSSVGVDADEVKPFFQSNVGMSAWGLAIHSQARILATSANTHSITIFKFGLVDADEQEQPPEGEDPSDENGVKSDQRRKTDVTEQALNGTSNIPHIAFCNTGDDPEARWLLTTDIGGFCRSIDVHAMTTAQAFRFGNQSYVSAHDHDRFNSGWTIMFLDKRSFLPEDDYRAALGLEDDKTESGVQKDSNLWDIGSSISNVPDTSERFGVPKRRARLVSTSTSGSSRLSGPDESPNEEASPNDSEDTTTTGTEDENDDEDLDDDSTDYVDMDSSDEGTEDSFSFSAMYGGRRIFGNEPRAFQFNNKSICDDIPCPILHSSVRNVYLLQPPHCAASEKSISESAFTPPTVGFTNALRQLVPSQHSWINSIERLNMHAYIPSIGVVVLASQKGRVLVLSLTKLSRYAEFPPPKYIKTKCPPNTVYTMRIERILPFASQEAAGERPFEPLAGIATGPMQGTEHLPDERKRWRLMLMYYDHSVLSYEISRRRTRDSGVDVRDVVV